MMFSYFYKTHNIFINIFRIFKSYAHHFVKKKYTPWKCPALSTFMKS